MRGVAKEDCGQTTPNLKARTALRVLGIDPGTVVTGWGVVEAEGQALTHIASGTIRTAAYLSPSQRLAVIFRGVEEVMGKWGPEAVSVERAFVARNVHSALRLGEARGVVLVAAARQGLPVFEYTPAEIKVATVGYGRAEKRQMEKGTALLLRLHQPRAGDAADALAAAICHLHHFQFCKSIQETAYRGQNRLPRKRSLPARSSWGPGALA